MLFDKDGNDQSSCRRKILKIITSFKIKGGEKVVNERIVNKINSFPRFSLIKNQTPIHSLENMSRKLNIDLKIKRDDLTGLAAGGNKTRKLEFLIGEALCKKAEIVLTAGWSHSNHALQTAAASGRAGLKSILFLKGTGAYRGSLFLDYLLGCEIKLFDVPGSSSLVPIMQKEAEKLKAIGEKPFVIPVGGSNDVGALGYVLGAIEIAGQCNKMEWQPDFIVFPTSSGGTHAGIFVGVKESLPNAKILGIGVGDNAEKLEKSVSDIVRNLNKLLAMSSFSEKNLKETFRFGYGFQNYGDIHPCVISLIAEFAQKEGIFLDPVYTGKAFLGLEDLVLKREIPPKSRVLFIHTGGLSSLFQYEEELVAFLKKNL